MTQPNQETSPEVPRYGRGVAVIALVAGGLGLSLAVPKLLQNPGNCVADVEGTIVPDVNVLECVNDVFGTELG